MTRLRICIAAIVAATATATGAAGQAPRLIRNPYAAPAVNSDRMVGPNLLAQPDSEARAAFQKQCPRPVLQRLNGRGPSDALAERSVLKYPLRYARRDPTFASTVRDDSERAPPALIPTSDFEETRDADAAGEASLDLEPAERSPPIISLQFATTQELCPLYPGNPWQGYCHERMQRFYGHRKLRICFSGSQRACGTRCTARQVEAAAEGHADDASEAGTKQREAADGQDQTHQLDTQASPQRTTPRNPLPPAAVPALRKASLKPSAR